jgi:Reverse transcriptase (RNA-dependent DNA polymerase)
LTFDPGSFLLILFLIVNLLIALFIPFSAFVYVRPRKSRMRRRYTRTAYHVRVRRLPSIRPRLARACHHHRKPPPQQMEPHHLSSFGTCESPRKSTPVHLRTSRSPIDSFLSTFDVLNHYKQFRSLYSDLLSTDFLSTTQPTSSRRRILLHASRTSSTVGYSSSLFKSHPDPTELQAPCPQHTPMVIDTGASWSITPHLSDFVSPLTPSNIDELHSLDNTIQVHGTGTVEWTVEDLNGNIRKLQCEALYIPTASVRLFSPQCYFMEHHGGSMTACEHSLILTLVDGFSLTFPWSDNNIPYMLTPEIVASNSTKAPSLGFTAAELHPPNPNATPLPSVLVDSNLNLTGSQKELLLWHQRLGHCGLKKVQSLFAQPRTDHDKPILQATHPRMTTCDLPRCLACQFAKQKRRNPPSKKQRPISEREGGLSDDVLQPGQRISCDLYQSTILGRLPNTRGKESDSEKYCGGAIFLDVASNFVFVRHQPNLTGAMTVSSKHELENFASEFGIKIKEYLSDNHPFRSQDFVQDCLNQNQNQTLSGVGAHHQNRVERTNQTIFNWSRAMLLHYILHWPQQARLDLWPYAVDYAVWLWNNIPDLGSRMSPLEIFTNTTFPDHSHLQRARVFGCPVFVLDPKLQDAKKLPKWQKRSWQGIFLGFSTIHHSSVALVLNPETGSITAQYHVIFDERFSTVATTSMTDENIILWESLIDNGYDRHFSLEPPEPDPNWFPPPDIDHRLHDHPPTPATTIPVQTPAPAIPPVTPVHPTSPNPHDPPIEPSFPSRRSAREPKVPSRLIETIDATQRTYLSGNLSKQTKYSPGSTLPRVPGSQLNNLRLATLQWDKLRETCIKGTYGSFLTELSRNSSDGFIEEWNPAFLATKANREDTPDWNTAMNGPHAAGFWKACQTEIDTLTEKGCWDIVPRPANRPIVSGTWAFRIKRFPDGSMRKLKARFCARGYEQTEGVDFTETFAPVVNWTTVRFLLMMSILLGLETRQVDYVAAFIQAEIDTEVYVEMPRGFAQPGKVLRLKKSLYGLKQSPRNHFQNLSSKLQALGFSSCDSDPCLFVSDKCICLVYVDDTLLYARSQSDIDDVVNGLRNLKMDLEEESDVAGFLGVLVDRRPDGSIHLLQKGLIQRILDALQIHHLPPKRTPAKLGVLSSDPEGDPPNGTFSYASVIGMLGYLQANSRPDLTYAVSQCARFTHSPKRSHEQALERIGQYLKHTANEGLILRPTSLTDTFYTDVYVDADFAGAWGYEHPSDPACVKSRTGFIIETMGCPIQWLSKLQPNIATSTMEAEYIALSVALRYAIPLLEVIRYVTSSFCSTSSSVLTFKTTVHEDNLGALRLAQMEPGRNTPRSKFYAIRYHWFRSHLKPNEIELQYIDTSLQKADMLTKSLPANTFEFNRKLSCGW